MLSAEMHASYVFQPLGLYQVGIAAGGPPCSDAGILHRARTGTPRLFCQV